MIFNSCSVKHMSKPSVLNNIISAEMFIMRKNGSGVCVR